MTRDLKHFRIDFEQQDRVTVWVDVADRSVNVLFEEVFDELHQVIDLLSEQSTKSAHALPVLFRSAKPKGFIVGADLKRILSIESDTEIQSFLECGQVALSRLESYAETTIALIQGPCLGGGLEFAMACRFRVAVDSISTRLGLPEAKLGLMPGWGGTQRLVEIMGFSNAMQMLLGGEPVDGRTAFEFGLVNKLITEQNLESQLTEYLRDGCKLHPHAADTNRNPHEVSNAQRLDTRSFTKAQSAIYQAVMIGLERSRDDGFQAERELFYPLLTSPEARAHLQKFAGSANR
jgi:3-hydroxyacyl-CoA dehydrogenase / enoyl-CoA hydratase / 3-hydroxybutyryl-CoA epimerase